MMKPRTTLLCLLVLAPMLMLVQQGCGPAGKLEISLPEGDVVPWGGSLQIVALIKDGGGKPEDGEAVIFTTTVGSFVPYDPARVTEPVRETDVDTLGGKATVQLYSFPGEGGKTGEIVGTFETRADISVQGSAMVTIADGGRPSGKFITAACDPKNVTALDLPQEAAEMRIRCVVTIKDITGAAVPVADIKYMVESGCSLTRDPEVGDAGEHIFMLQPDCQPADVEPIGGEPSHMDAGVIHNPRDGLLSIMFYVAGQEGFSDDNQNGVYDAGEGFVGQDLPEPFLDINDNGEWDPGESYKDSNGDGQYSAADGRWNSDTFVWASTRIMFTGPPHQSADTTRFEPSGINVVDGGNTTLTLYLMDENHNPIAKYDDSDRLEFDIQDATIIGSDRIDLIPYMGVEFNTNGQILPESFNIGRDYQVTLEDKYKGDTTPYSVQLQTSVTWTPAPDFDSYSANTQTVNLNPVSGTIN